MPFLERTTGATIKSFREEVAAAGDQLEALLRELYPDAASYADKRFIVRWSELKDDPPHKVPCLFDNNISVITHISR